MTNRILVYNNENSYATKDRRYIKIGHTRLGLRGDLIFIKGLFEKLSIDEAIKYLKQVILCSATPKSTIIISMEDLRTLIHELENKKT